VYDYEDPLFGSHWWEAATVVPIAKPLKVLKLGRAADLWGKADTLGDHFARHGADFSAKTADEYVQLGSEFLRRSQVDRLPTKIDADGVIRVYDPSTNTFGAFNADGTIRTFFKPKSSTYFDRQPGVEPWQP
jgi:pyocin large subunit-like protein